MIIRWSQANFIDVLLHHFGVKINTNPNLIVSPPKDDSKSRTKFGVNLGILIEFNITRVLYN